MSRNRTARGLASILALTCATATPASAAFLTGVTATTPMGTFSSYSLPDLTNGSGLSSYDLSGLHSSLYTDMWMAASGNTTGSVVFDLGSTQFVNVVAIWNYNYNPNATCCVTRGVMNLNISWSQDGVNFFPLSSEVLPIGNGSPIPVHAVNTGGVNARYFQFDILSNHGNSTYTGLSEVQFDVSTCEPKPYGAGCAGSGGFVPEISATCPVAGQPVTLKIDKGLGGSTTLLFLGVAKVALPTGNGCQLFVAPILPLIVPIPLGGSGAGNGTASLMAVMPPSATGLTFTMQDFVGDPGAPGGYCASNGLEWIVP